jgi:hypothetical protein
MKFKAGIYNSNIALCNLVKQLLQLYYYIQ